MSDELTPTRPGDPAGTLPAPDGATAGEWLNHWARTAPQGAALRTVDATITWAELATMTAQAADVLHGLGLRAGDRVLVQWPNRAATLQLYLACWRLGVIPVAAHRRLTPHEVAQLTERVEPSLHLGVGADDELTLQDDRSTHWSALLIDFISEKKADSLLPAATEPDAPAILLPTSGTTGQPKLVLHTYRSLAAQGRSARTFGLAPGDPVLGELPLMHSSGLFVWLIALYSGSPLTLLDFEPRLAVELAARDRCRWVGGLPLIVDAFAREQQRVRLDLSAITTFAVAGDLCPEPVRERLRQTFGIAPRTFWGATEANGALSFGRDPSSSSIPADTSVRLMNAENQPVRTGESGELQLRSPCAAIGYWQAPGRIETLPDGWLRTGDLMSRDGDQLRFQGRLKDLIVTGAVNVSPVEVEAVLLSDPDVQAAGVTGVADELLGQRVVAALVLRPGATADDVLARLRQLLPATLSAPKVPARLCVVTDLPRTALGKIDRRRLAEHVGE